MLFTFLRKSFVPVRRLLSPPDGRTDPFAMSQEESKVPGMGQIESKRRVTAMDTILSKDPLDTTDPGYQFCKPEPKQEGQVTNQKKEGNYKKKGQAKGPRNYN